MATNTASSLTTHTGNGSTTAFAISFSFLADSEIDVTVAGVATTHYTISGSTLTFTSGNTPANGAAIRFQRDTDISAKKVDFQDGSVLTEADLDANSDQVLFAQQEIIDKLGTIEEGATGDQTAAEIRTLVESASDSNVFTDADHSKLNAIEASATADQTASEIRTLVESASDSNVFTDADHSKLNAIEASATADQTAAEIRTLVESASDSNVFTDADHTKVNNAVTLTDTQTLTNKTLTTPVINDLSGSAVVTSGTSTSDNKVYSAKRAGEIFYGKDTVGEIQSGETWSSTDDKVATTAAIDARVIDLVDDVGGFVPIANELSFPNANPDVNNGAGTLVSIKALSTAYTSNGSGQFTITNGTVGNSTVTITGATASTTFAAGFGMIVETSSTLNTYTFHRLVPKATEVTTVAGSISNVNTVAGISGNVTTVAGIAANVTTVAGISSNVTSVAGSIANVNTVAGNLSGVNSFAERYSVGSSNPTSNLDVGDLFFNTTANELKVYNGSAWQGGVTATGNFASATGNVFTGDNRYNDNIKALFGTGSDLEIFHNTSDSIINDAGTGNLKLQLGGSTKLEVTSTGGTLTGSLNASADATINSVTVGKGANSVAGNTVLGENALDASVSGGNNTAIGNTSLSALTSGARNVGVGFESLLNLTTGDDNTALGSGALNACTTASDNVAVGRNALVANTTGSTNVAVGALALDANTTGSGNTSLGKSSLSANTTASNNTAVGNDALKLNTTGDSNVAVGATALDANTTGNANVAIGLEALTANTTASQNTALGHKTLKSNTTAANNTAVGFKALEANTTGSDNVALGKSALSSNQTSNANTAVGSDSLESCTTGDSNVAVGAAALKSLTTTFGCVGVGKEALESVTTGQDNTAVGRKAGENITGGQENLCLGYNAGNTGSPSGNITTASRNVVLGDDNIVNLFCADTSISSSDSRDKTDITDFSIGLKWIEALRPVTYKWDKRSWYGTDENTLGTPDGSKKSSKTHIGFLAQEVLTVEKANGYGSSNDNSLLVNLTDDGMRYGMKYERLVPILVNAIKELSAKVTALEAG